MKFFADLCTQQNVLFVVWVEKKNPKPKWPRGARLDQVGQVCGRRAHHAELLQPRGAQGRQQGRDGGRVLTETILHETQQDEAEGKHEEDDTTNIINNGMSKKGANARKKHS
jgi:hypothetical protein